MKKKDKINSKDSYLPLSILFRKISIFLILGTLISLILNISFNFLVEQDYSSLALLVFFILTFSLFVFKIKNKQHVFSKNDFLENENICLELDSVWISAPISRWGMHEQIEIIITDLRLIWKFKNRYFNFWYDDIFKNVNRLSVKGNSDTKIIQEIKICDNPPSVDLLIKGLIVPLWYKMFFLNSVPIYNTLLKLIDERKVKN